MRKFIHTFGPLIGAVILTALTLSPLKAFGEGQSAIPSLIHGGEFDSPFNAPPPVVFVPSPAAPTPNSPAPCTPPASWNPQTKQCETLQVTGALLTQGLNALLAHDWVTLFALLLGGAPLGAAFLMRRFSAKPWVHTWWAPLLLQLVTAAGAACAHAYASGLSPATALTNGLTALVESLVVWVAWEAESTKKPADLAPVPTPASMPVVNP